MATIYNGTIYQPGEEIPGFITTPVTPHIWYDQSKSYTSPTRAAATTIFNALSINEGLVLGDDEKDLWDNEEILSEMLKYLDLHIVMVGCDYYIFDWATVRDGQGIQWIDIFTGETKTISPIVVGITRNNYGSNDTQISIDDVYNQIQITDDIDEIDDVVIADPVGSGDTTALSTKQKYMVEYGATGMGTSAYEKWIDLIGNQIGDYYYNDGKDSAYTREWWMRVNQNPYWSFKLNDTDNYSVIPIDSDGLRYNQWKMLESLYVTPFFSGLVSFGSGEKVDNHNYADIQNISVKDNYLCIAINGSGYDEKYIVGHPEWANRIFPKESDLENLNMRIETASGLDANFTPANADVTHYILISGKLLMTVRQQTTGELGYIAGHINDEPINDQTKATNEGRGDIYIDGQAFLRQNNFADALRADKNSHSNYYYKGRTVPSDKNDDGQYYAQEYFTYPRTADTPVADHNKILLSPPDAVGGILSKRFNYTIGNNRKSIWENDVINYVDILACQLQIGDKYCVESHDAQGNKTFQWMTSDEIDYELAAGNDPYFQPFVYIAVDIDDGQFLIGDEHDIYNNVSTDMGLENAQGMAIPIRHTDSLSGKMKFTIIGPVNNVWDQGVRRHPTWFRHTRWTSGGEVSILPHIGQIWIKNLEVKLVSDHGKIEINGNNDIVYLSDEQQRFMNKKEDDFKLTTALTSEEAMKLGVAITANRSDVIDSATGKSILNITNNKAPVGEQTDKPEKFYVDAYYREYKDPKMVVSTTLHTGQGGIYNPLSINRFNRYSISYLNKMFIVRATEYDVKNGVTKIDFKEL